MMRRLPVSHPCAISEAVDCLSRGELVVLPTDTVYGLACDALDPGAVERLMRAKGRPDGKPLPVQVGDVDALSMVWADPPVELIRFARCIWPGAVTVVYHAASGLPQAVTAGSGSAGVRIAADAIVRDLLRIYRRPIALPSANLSGEPAARSLDDLPEMLQQHIAMALDAGPCASLPPSTVCDVRNGEVRILREGPVEFALLRQYWAACQEAAP